MPEPLVRYTLDGRTAILHMDDGKANALSEAMLTELDAALDRASADAAAIVLTGRTDRFCAGFDLKVMMSGPAPAVALLRRGAGVLLRLFELPQPLVIACTGHALAGGALVLMTGDLRLCVDGPYKIGLTEVGIGMPVPELAMELARARLLPTSLTEATLMSRIYTPGEAATVGYVDRIVAPESLMSVAVAEAARLGQLSRHAFAGTKLRLRRHVAEQIRSGFEADVGSMMPR